VDFEAIPEQEPGAVEADGEIRGGDPKPSADVVATLFAYFDRQEGIRQVLRKLHEARSQGVPEFAAFESRTGVVVPGERCRFPVPAAVEERLDRGHSLNPRRSS
jgi:hypothetical protein